MWITRRKYEALNKRIQACVEACDEIRASLWGLKQEVAHLREYLGIAYVRTPATTRLQKVATRRGR